MVKEEIEAKEYLANLNKELAKRTNVDTEAAWAYASNINDENEKEKRDIRRVGQVHERSLRWHKEV